MPSLNRKRSLQTHTSRSSQVPKEMTYSSLCLLIAAMHSYSAGFPLVTFEMLNDYFQNQVRSSAAAPVQVNGGGIGMVNVKRPVLASVRVTLSISPSFWVYEKSLEF